MGKAAQRKKFHRLGEQAHQAMFQRLKANENLKNARVEPGMQGAGSLAEALLILLGPLTKVGIYEVRRQFVGMAAVAWNSAGFPEQEAAGLQSVKEIFGALPAVERITANLMRQKQLSFASDRRVLAEYEYCEDEEGRFFMLAGRVSPPDLTIFLDSYTGRWAWIAKAQSNG
jgi:hypothetical protein